MNAFLFHSYGLFCLNLSHKNPVKYNEALNVIDKSKKICQRCKGWYCELTLSRNQSGRLPEPSIRSLIFLSGAMSSISTLKVSSWPRSNLSSTRDSLLFLILSDIYFKSRELKEEFEKHINMFRPPVLILLEQNLFCAAVGTKHRHEDLGVCSSILHISSNNCNLIYKLKTRRYFLYQKTKQDLIRWFFSPTDQHWSVIYCLKVQN